MALIFAYAGEKNKTKELLTEVVKYTKEFPEDWQNLYKVAKKACKVAGVYVKLLKSAKE